MEGDLNSSLEDRSVELLGKERAGVVMPEIDEDRVFFNLSYEIVENVN